MLIVDDSALISTLLSAMLEDVPDIQVVGLAATGQEAVRLTLRLHPDVITMDIRMPHMDGLEATRQLMRVQPTPIIVVSSAVYATDYNIAFNAIEAGALTVIEKPKGLGLQDYDVVRDQLITAIRTMAGLKLAPHRDKAPQTPNIGPMTAMLHTYFIRTVQVIAIAASTGGPPVLMQLLSSLPPNFAVPVVIAQHMLPAFVPGLMDWLNSRSQVPVSIAVEGERLAPGRAYLAAGNTHLTVTPERTLHLDYSSVPNEYRPSANRLFQSIARAYSSHAIGIVLTGMGDDGAAGLATLASTGAHIIAQDEATSVVFGMPKAAIDRNLVDEVLSPDEIVSRLSKLHRLLQPPR